MSRLSSFLRCQEPFMKFATLKAMPLAIALAVSTFAPAALAQQGAPIGALGRWTLDLSASRFNEALTGAAPMTAELDITKDDGAMLAWTLVENDPDGVAATQFADAKLDGTPSRAVVNMVAVNISITREGAHGVNVVTKGDAGRRQSMKVWLADPNTIKIEQDVDGQPGPPDQTLTFRRVK
jgi:hypothetical protein